MKELLVGSPVKITYLNIFWAEQSFIKYRFKKNVCVFFITKFVVESLPKNFISNGVVWPLRRHTELSRIFPPLLFHKKLIEYNCIEK